MKRERTFRLSMMTAIVLVMVACGPPAVPEARPGEEALPTRAAPSSSIARSDWEERWKNTILEAKKEKSALIYMAPSPETQRAITAAFKQKFDIDLEFIIGRGAALSERIFAERRAGLYLGDIVVQGNSVQLLILKPKDVLEVLDPFLILPEVTDPKVWLGGRFPFLDKDHSVIYFLAGMRIDVARNTEMVREDEIRSLNDLLQPRWKGQIIMFDPTIAGSGSLWFALVFGLLGREKGADYMRQFRKQEPVISRDDRMMIEGLARGKYKISVGMSKGLFTEFKGNGAPVALVRTVEGNFLNPGPGDISILKKAPHPNTATVFFNWLLTKEAQTIFSKTYGIPSARVDVDTTGLDPYEVPPPGEKFYLQTEEDVLAYEELMLIAKGIFAPLLK